MKQVDADTATEPHVEWMRLLRMCEDSSLPPSLVKIEALENQMVDIKTEPYVIQLDELARLSRPLTRGVMKEAE